MTPNAIEDPREEAGGLAEARVLRVEIDVPISRVLEGRVMTGLDRVKLNQAWSSIVRTPRCKQEDE